MCEYWLNEHHGEEENGKIIPGKRESHWWAWDKKEEDMTMIKKIYAHAKGVENNIKEEEIIKSNGKLNL